MSSQLKAPDVSLPRRMPWHRTTLIANAVAGCCSSRRCPLPPPPFLPNPPSQPLPRPQHATSIANVATRWVLQQPAVPAVILGARNAAHVGDHQRLFEFELDGDDLAAVEGLLAGGKQPTGDCYAWERGGSF